MMVENGAFYAQFHPDGQRVLSVSNGKAVLIWWVTGCVSIPFHASFKAASLEFSSDSTRVVFGGKRGSAQVWEPVTGRQPIELSGHDDYVGAVACRPDGKYIATGSYDGTCRVWDAATGQPVGKRLKMGELGAKVTVVQFTPDSKKLLTAWAFAGCGRCVEVCPHGVFAMQEKLAVLTDRDQCMECGACAMNCGFGAITVSAGVGCAAAIITGMLTGQEPSCGCDGGAAGGCC